MSDDSFAAVGKPGAVGTETPSWDGLGWFAAALGILGVA